MHFAVLGFGLMVGVSRQWWLVILVALTLAWPVGAQQSPLEVQAPSDSQTDGAIGDQKDETKSAESTQEIANRVETLRQRVEELEAAVAELSSKQDQANANREGERERAESALDVSQADLEAQQSMASSTASMTSSAWLQVILTFCALAVLVATLVVTWGMWGQAKQTTEATKEMLNDTKEATRITKNAAEAAEVLGRHQARAYVTAARPHREGKFEIGKPVAVRFDVRNGGQSPALNVAVAARVEIREAEINDNREHFTGLVRHLNGFPLSPDTGYEIVAQTEENLSGEVVAKIQNRTANVYVYGRIVWQTMFGERWRTVFQFVGTMDQIKTEGPFRVCIHANKIEVMSDADTA